MSIIGRLIHAPSSRAYEESYKLYHYKDDMFRLVKFNKKLKGWDIEGNKKNKKEEYLKKLSNDYLIDRAIDGFDIFKDETKRCSLSRTKKEIREICLCNDFKYFVTLTVDSKNADRFSLQECQDLLHKLIKEYSRRIKRISGDKFHYILITEKHKNGAFHFHGLFSDLLSTDIYKNQYGYISSHFFDEKLRFCSFSKIKDILKCANYITKYITKDCIKNEHNQIYFCSNGLLRAEVYDLSARNILPEYDLSKKFWTFTNNYCNIKDFHFDNLSYNDKMFLFTNFSQLKYGAYLSSLLLCFLIVPYYNNYLLLFYTMVYLLF